MSLKQSRLRKCFYKREVSEARFAPFHPVIPSCTVVPFAYRSCVVNHSLVGPSSHHVGEVKEENSFDEIESDSDPPTSNRICTSDKPTP